MVVEIRDWCQNVGEYNTYNCCIWHFGLCVIVSKIDRCRSSDPPYEIAINPWWRGGRGLPSLIALLKYAFVMMCRTCVRMCTVAISQNTQIEHRISQLREHNIHHYHHLAVCSTNHIQSAHLIHVIYQYAHFHSGTLWSLLMI